MQVREKVAKWPNTVFFLWFVAPEGRKVGSLKRQVRSHLVRWEMKSCTPLQSKGRSQKCKKLTVSDHFWKLRCPKSARRSGAKHISKSTCTKHTRIGTLLEVEMSEKCTPLWREAHFQVNMYKAHQDRNTFGSWDVEKVYAVVARSTFPSQNVQNTPGSELFWKLRCRKSVRRCGAKHISKSKCAKHTRIGTLLDVELSKKCILHFDLEMCFAPQHSVHFFDISTCKSGPTMVCLVHFDFEMCFAPQRRALFRHLNVQKWSEHVVFFTFWLRNVLRATTARTFSTSQRPKVVRTCGVFYILTSKCASRQRALFRHLNFQKRSDTEVFCTFSLRNVLRATTACNFSSLIWPAGAAPAALASLLFDPPEPQIIGKTQCFATFLPFLASASSLFLLFLFYSSFFSSLCLFSALLFICPYCRKFDF